MRKTRVSAFAQIDQYMAEELDVAQAPQCCVIKSLLQRSAPNPVQLEEWSSLMTILWNLPTELMLFFDVCSVLVIKFYLSLRTKSQTLV